MKEGLLVSGPVNSSLVAEYISKLSSDKSAGAHSIFLGQVRNDKLNELTVKAIEYSAYAEMVEKEYNKIRDTIMSAFNDVKDLIIIHSEGIVKVGELSLMVIVTAGHRDQSTRACRHAIEMIKENYPVWKKELFDDDSHRWKEPSNIEY